MSSVASPHGGEIFDRRLVGDSASWSAVCGQCDCEVEGETTETVQLPANALYAERSRVKRNTAATVLRAILSLATACAPAAPTLTRTPEPTPTPVEVRATKTEHLAGRWLAPPSSPGD
jgi:hypothetical protein